MRQRPYMSLRIERRVDGEDRGIMLYGPISFDFAIGQNETVHMVTMRQEGRAVYAIQAHEREFNQNLANVIAYIHACFVQTVAG